MRSQDVQGIRGIRCPRSTFGAFKRPSHLQCVFPGQKQNKARILPGSFHGGCFPFRKFRSTPMKGLPGLWRLRQYAQFFPSKQIRAYFGIEANSKGTTNRSLARIFLVYDVLTGLTPSAGLGRTNTEESGMLDVCLK